MMITDPGQNLSESLQIVRPISQKNKLRFRKLSPSRPQDVERMEMDLQGLFITFLQHHVVPAAFSHGPHGSLDTWRRWLIQD